MAASTQSNPDLDNLPAILTVEEVAEALRIGRSAAYELVRSGGLPAVRIGRTIRVSRQALLAWIDGAARAGELGAALDKEESVVSLRTRSLR